MLIMPNSKVPDAAWKIAEQKEMEEVVGLYGKTFHFWQIDRGHELPLGMPELMMSYTKPEQVSNHSLLPNLGSYSLDVVLAVKIRGNCWWRYKSDM